MARLPLFLRRSPPPEAIRWVERSLGRDVRITSMERLRTGTSAAVHLIRTRTSGGVARAVVLRRFVRADWLGREPDLAEREARILQTLAGTGVPSPELLAVDPIGAECDVPAVLMARLPGRVDINPSQLDAFVKESVRALVTVHHLPSISGIPSYFPYFAASAAEFLRVPAWSKRSTVWAQAIKLVREPWPQVAPSFIHRDYHPGNLLWQRGQLSGITDWVNACNGPPGIDVAHCRINLVQLFGLGVADDFRQAYESETGQPHHPFWDLMAVVDGGTPDAAQWHDAGRTDLTDALMMQRREDYLESILLQLC